MFGLKPFFRELGIVSSVSAFLILIIDLCTNSLDIHTYQWDFKSYIDMAEHGIVGNAHLASPFAYRWGTTTLARLLILSGITTEHAFMILAYTGALAQLLSVYYFSRYLHKDFFINIYCVLIVAFSFPNLKFLIFDVYRPDHFAYALMVIGLWSVLRKKTAIAVTVTIIGLQFREFLAIPSVLLLIVLLRESYRLRTMQHLSRMLIIVVFLLSAILIPRLVIPVTESYQIIDPLHGSGLLSDLLERLTNAKLTANILFGTIAYLLPSLLFVTRERFGALQETAETIRPVALWYSCAVLLLTFYGGTDIMRYVSYLFIPQILFITLILSQGRLSAAELALVLIFTVIFNRILLDIPMWSLNAYINFFGFFGSRINIHTFFRVGEIASFLLCITMIRKHIRRRELIR